MYIRNRYVNFYIVQYSVTIEGTTGRQNMECGQEFTSKINKISGWFKKISGEDRVSQKTHKVYTDQSIYLDNIKLLSALGSGTICLRLEKLKAFNLDLIASNALLRLSVSQHGIKLYCIYRGRFILLKEQISAETGLSKDLQCSYWVSFNGRSRTVYSGKNEPTFQNNSFSFTLPKSNKTPEQYWMNKIAHYRVDSPAVIYLSKQTVRKKEANTASINLLSAKP